VVRVEQHGTPDPIVQRSFVLVKSIYTLPNHNFHHLAKIRNAYSDGYQDRLQVLMLSIIFVEPRQLEIGATIIVVQSP
jgi:hypothetical protein